MTRANVLVTRLFVLALVASWLMGCASTKAIATSSDEWIAYRKSRVSPTLEGRIIAAARYLARYPDGAFVPQTQAYFRFAEPIYFDAKRSAPDGLYAYLAALPRGPHADEARQLLVFLADKPKGPVGFDAVAMATGARVAKLAAIRLSAREEIVGSIRVWLDPAAFAKPISEAGASLVIPWSLSLPRARCTALDGDVARVCVKLLEPAYEVTNGQTLEDRQATFEVAVSQDGFGRPRSVVISGPDLFGRLEETFGGRTIAPDDPSGRAAAVSRATEVVRREFAAGVSDDVACRKRAKRPAVMELRCKGIHAVVEAALDGTDEDRIVIESE